MRNEQLNSYFRMLEDDGWTYFYHGAQQGTDWWKLRFKTPERRIELYVSLGKDCLLWQMPMLNDPPTPSCWLALYRYLLQVNHEIKLAKFTLDSDNRIWMVVEILTTTCSYATIKAVLTAMRVYFEHYHREIEMLATNVELARAWLSLLPQSDDLDITIVRSDSEEHATGVELQQRSGP